MRLNANDFDVSNVLSHLKGVGENMQAVLKEQNLLKYELCILN